MSIGRSVCKYEQEYISALLCFVKHKFFVLLTAEREEMISCVYVNRDEERVAVAFSRPVNVSISTFSSLRKCCNGIQDELFFILFF